MKRLACLALGVSACLHPNASGTMPAIPADGPPAVSSETAKGLLENEVPFQVWPELGASRVGLLVSFAAPWGTAIGWTRGVAQAGGSQQANPNYYFFSDGASPWALYFQSKGEGYNVLRGWSVPLPGGGQGRYDAAMFSPGTPNAWGLSASAHLVELEVNDGRGAASNIHFVATDARVLDGTDEYPLDPARTLEQARARFDAMVADREAVVQRELDAADEALGGQPYGAEVTTVNEGLFPTWMIEARRLRVLFYRRVTRSSSKQERQTIVHHCPPGAPCMPPHEEIMTITRAYGVSIGLELEFDASGALIAERAYEPAR